MSSAQEPDISINISTSTSSISCGAPNTVHLLWSAFTACFQLPSPPLVAQSPMRLHTRTLSPAPAYDDNLPMPEGQCAPSTSQLPPSHYNL